MNPRTTPITAIFFDLDSTLIHAQTEEPACETVPPAAVLGPYFAWLRPCARKMISTANATGAPLYLCTASERRYAVGMTKLFDLGFAENQILGCEHLSAGETRLAPGSILIDDLPPDAEMAVSKRLVLGIGVERYFQVPPFTATNFEFEQSLVDCLHRFFDNASSTPTDGL